MTTVSATSTTPVPAPTNAAATVANTANGSLAQDAVSLAADSSLVSLLGAGDPFGATYDAAGLFNAIAHAGTPDAASAAQAASPASVDQLVVDSLAQPDSASAALNALAATVPTGTIDQTSSYAAILKQTPSAASTVIADSFAQGIISTISTWA